MINLTQHVATQDQLDAGVSNLDGEALAELKKLLTFETLEDTNHVIARADAIVALVKEYAPATTSAMIGGAPFFMPTLQAALVDAGIRPYYAFSQRVVVEVPTTDGAVEKKAIFKHMGFVPGFDI